VQTSRGFLFLPLRFFSMIERSDQSFQDQAPDFRARVYLLTTEDGGRKGPAGAGYRPQVYFEIQVEGITGTSGSWQELATEQVFPGETAEIGISILAKAPFSNKLFVGLKFLLKEGSVTIGTGEILEIYNQALST
jgi:elongation factor Tu